MIMLRNTTILLNFPVIKPLRSNCSLYLALLFALIAVVGCGNKEEAQQGYSKTYTDSQTGLWLTVSAPQTTLNVAESIQLVIRHNYPSDLSILPYSMTAEGLKGFLWSSPLAEYSVGTDGLLEETQIYRLEPEDIGEFEIQPPPFVFSSNPADLLALDNGGADKLTPEPFKVKVESVLSESDTISDIYDVTILNNILVYVVGGLAVGLALAWGILFFSFPKTGGAPSGLTPLEYTMQEFKRLEELLDSERISAAELYLELNTVFKYFLDHHLRLSSAGETLEETIDRILRLKDMDSKRKKLVEDFASISNIVKFAGYEPNLRVCQEALKSLKELIIEHSERLP